MPTFLIVSPYIQSLNNQLVLNQLILLMCFPGPVPPKVQTALSKARKLGGSLVQFLDESKNIRSLFKDATTEADSAAIVNYLALASARLTYGNDCHSCKPVLLINDLLEQRKVVKT